MATEISLNPLARYEEAKQRLLDTLQVVDETLTTSSKTLGHSNVRDFWGTSDQNEGIHLRLVQPYTPTNFMLLLAHLEKGSIHATTIPETVVIQCVAGRFRVVAPDGESWVVGMNGHIEIKADISYIYEALEETYNIMKVSNRTDAKDLA